MPANVSVKVFETSDKTCLILRLIMPRTDILFHEGFMRLKCTFCSKPNLIFLNSVFYLPYSSSKSNSVSAEHFSSVMLSCKWIYFQSCVVHVLFICVKITPNTCIVPVSWRNQAKEKPGTPPLPLKQELKNIWIWMNAFKEQDDLPDSWSILIESAGLWGAESSLRE